MAGKVINIKFCSPLKLYHGLTGKCHAICHYSYVCREAVNGKYKSLHAVIEMVEFSNGRMIHRSRLAGEGFKPPKGAVVKSYGAERLGKVHPRGVQVRIKEMNESEPPMRCRESGTICQKL